MKHTVLTFFILLFSSAAFCQFDVASVSGQDCQQWLGKNPKTGTNFRFMKTSNKGDFYIVEVEDAPSAKNTVTVYTAAFAKTMNLEKGMCDAVTDGTKNRDDKLIEIYSDVEARIFGEINRLAKDVSDKPVVIAQKQMDLIQQLKELRSVCSDFSKKIKSYIDKNAKPSDLLPPTAI